MSGPSHWHDQPPPAPAAGARDRRPRAVTTAVVLLVVAAVLWLPIPPYVSGVTTLATVALLAHVVFAVLAVGGQRYARTGVSIAAGLLALLLGPYVWLGFSDPDNLYGAEYAVMTLLAVAASATAITLLFSPSGNDYYRDRPRPPL